MSNNSYSIEGRIITDNEPIDLDGIIYNMSYINKYTENVFPLLSIELNISSDEYKTITYDTKISMSIKTFTDIDNNATNFYKYFFQDVKFSIIEKQIINQSSSDNEDILKCRLYIIPIDDIQLNRLNFNCIVKDSDLNSILMYLFRKVNNKDILLEPSDNDKIFDQIIIPKNNLFRTLKYLDEVYGIYKNGIEIFCDLDKIYCINSFGNKIEGKETIALNIVEDLNEIEYIRNNTINVLQNKISISNMNKIQSEISGNTNIVVVDTGTNGLKNYQKEISDGNKIKTYYQKYANPFLSEKVTQSNRTYISLYVSDINLYYLNCINEFYVLNDKDNKKYQLFECYNTFEKSGECFVLNSMLKLVSI